MPSLFNQFFITWIDSVFQPLKTIVNTYTLLAFVLIYLYATLLSFRGNILNLFGQRNNDLCDFWYLFAKFPLKRCVNLAPITNEFLS
jgi:hypothetical protein